MGLDATSVGNHEFDEGYKELLRMQKGGCINDGDGQNNQNSCPDHKFKGADFKYLSANVFYENTDKTLFAPYTVKNFRGGQKVAFIGMTLENTPNIVTKSGVQGLAFKDEVETANALVPKLKKQGIEAIVVLIARGRRCRPTRRRSTAARGSPARSSTSPRTSTRRSTRSSPVTPTRRTTARSTTRRASRGSSPAPPRSARSSPRSG